MKYIFFLGNHPEISATEVWHVLEAQQFTPRLLAGNDQFLLADIARPLTGNFLDGLGGIEKIAQVIGEQATEWTAEDILNLLSPASSRKFSIGISIVGMPARSGKDIAVTLKKQAREQGVKLRFILPKGKNGQLNSAQVIFNKLTEDPHKELTIIHQENFYYLATTTQVQDIQAYEKRDTLRPARDPWVGMLPPKLAQVMLNIATPSLPSSPSILDPFCGTGTVLQEGWLKGLQMTGSDKEETLVEATKQNLKWVGSQFSVPSSKEPQVIQHDVREPFLKGWQSSFDAIVTEPYLGQPLRSPLPSSEVEKYIDELADLYLAFFKHALSVLKPRGRIVFLFPAWRRTMSKNSDFWLFPQGFLDEVTALGYSLEQLVPGALQERYPSTQRGTLLYSRPDAFVGREITLWSKAS